MPRLDPGMQSGKIVEWLKKEGDRVDKGESIVIVEGEKTTFDVEAPESGVLTKILATAGTDVQVSQPMAVIGESTAPLTTATRSAAVPKSEPIPTVIPSRAPAATISERVVASPAARRLAQEYGLDITRISGTGPGGRISREDILTFAKQVRTSTPTSKARQPAVRKKTKLEGIRRAVAERLSFSARNVVPVTLTMEADATSLVSLKEREDHLNFTAFTVKAVAKALENHPPMNSSIEDDEITTYSDINISVAINTEEGLVAPTIASANKKTLREINAETEQLAQKARENRLTVEDLTGGTFTISNMGAYDIESFAPAINPPQCAILGLGRIADKPFAKGEKVSARPMIMLTLVFDHRIVDGVPAARFLQDVKKLFEDPQTIS